MQFLYETSFWWFSPTNLTVCVGLVSPRINVWGTSAEILFWWSVLSKFSTNQKHYPSLGSDALSVWHWFHGGSSAGVWKSHLFSQATFSLVSYFKTLWKLCMDKSKSANKNIVWQPSWLSTAKRGFHITTRSENLPRDCRKDKRGKILNKLVLGM